MTVQMLYYNMNKAEITRTPEKSGFLSNRETADVTVIADGC